MEAWADFLDLPELRDPRFKSRPGRTRYWQALGELVLSKQQSWKSHEFFNQAMDRRFVVGVIQSPTEVINCKSYSIGARSSSFPVVAARCTHASRKRWATSAPTCRGRTLWRTFLGFPQVVEWEEQYLPAEWLRKYEDSIGGYELRAALRSTAGSYGRVSIESLAAWATFTRPLTCAR